MGRFKKCSHVNERNHQCENRAYVEYDFCLSHLTPCPYHEVKERGSVEAKNYKAPLECGKLPMPKSIYCPKHDLMVSEIDAEKQRRANEMKLAREKNAMQREALASSPLAAVNPDADPAYRYTEPK